MASGRRVVGAVAVGEQTHGLGGPLHQEGQGKDYEDDGHSGDADGYLPAEGQDHPAGYGGDGSAKAVAHGDQGHGQAAAAAEPVVDGGYGGIVVAGAEAHRHEADEDQQEEEVVAGVGQQDEPQSGHDAAEAEHEAGSQAVGEVAHDGALDAAHETAQGVGPADGGGAEAEAVLDGQDVDGEAAVEAALLDAIGYQADQDYPPAVEQPGEEREGPRW